MKPCFENEVRCPSKAVDVQDLHALDGLGRPSYMETLFRRLGVIVYCAIVMIVIGGGSSFAASNDWAEGTPGMSTGASRDYYNSAGRLKWKNFMGDWRDADNVEQGRKPFATASVVSDGKTKPVEWDVTLLVRQWLDGKSQNQGFFLRTVHGDGTCLFRSREEADKTQRPQLIVETEKRSHALSPTADTYLDLSTYRSLGNKDDLRVGGKQPALLRFELNQLGEGVRVHKATLRLMTFRQYGRQVEIGVFRCSQGHDLPPSDPIPGLAARYLRDEGIGDDADVLFATQFESDNWNEKWSYAGNMKVIDTVAADARREFKPQQGKALRVKIAKGSNGALNTIYKFKQKIDKEPEAIYFRYYLRLAADWNQTLQGGKLPGISGTYGVAGWGGRKSDGTDGWSARGLFTLTIPAGNPLAGTTPIGTYCYHADMEGSYGTNWVWQNDYRGFLENNRWYSIEQYLKMNTPGKKDGILRAWIDGRLAFEKNDIRFRHTPKLKIEQIWMNVYHGGKKPSPYDQHLFIDNVVIAKSYIGPIKQKE